MNISTLPQNMDPECVALCNAINSIPYLHTIESCCGHGKDYFRIWLFCENNLFLPILLYFLDSCHIDFDWDCIVKTDCAMSPVHFCIQSRSTGDVAYREAAKITEEITSYLNTVRTMEDWKDYNMASLLHNYWTAQEKS